MRVHVADPEFPHHTLIAMALLCAIATAAGGLLAWVLL